MSNGDYVAGISIHLIVSVLQFTDMCHSLSCKTPLNSLYSNEDLQQLEMYSAIHVHFHVKGAVKGPIESIHKSIKLFINYSSLYSSLSALNLLTFCAASVSPKGYFSAGASDFQNLCYHLSGLFDARSWQLHKAHAVISHHWYHIFNNL